MSIVEQKSRAPDAAQRYFSGALQSRGPCISECAALWVPALRSNAESVAARPGHGRRRSQIPRQLGFELPVDGVLDLAARDPDVAQGAVVEFVQRLDRGAVLQAVEQRRGEIGERAEKSA